MGEFAWFFGELLSACFVAKLFSTKNPVVSSCLNLTMVLLCTDLLTSSLNMLFRLDLISLVPRPLSLVPRFSSLVKIGLSLTMIIGLELPLLSEIGLL